MGIHTFESMGTMVSIRLAQEPTDDDSELSRIARGDLALPAASAGMRGAYAEALAWRERTNGAFTPHRPDGGPGPVGAGQSAGHRTRGDILTSGVPRQGAWLTGIVDPADRSALLTAHWSARRASASLSPARPTHSEAVSDLTDGTNHRRMRQDRAHGPFGERAGQ